ncbi:MAG: rRNA maturation RNase YbeY [Acidimicrobiaceae bacterium]|nr:rRNA maturation RNase YbeY [Acidimicrobiaceae bacterium]MBT5579692.1 rRNA maturation RNase YbeY [Acidimicrobiaceae bacterium]MBT5850083.1 rRNA maturation RNase YbeY [Acidimicrobiaceae bacterium]
MTDPASPVVVAVDEQDELVVDLDRWSTLAQAALEYEGVPTGELNLLFVETDSIRELNREHMGKDRPTDVLSFPLDDDDGLPGETLLGDVVVCPAVAAANAPEHDGQGHHRGSVDDEIALLVVHGVLHVLGYDHINDDEAEEMEALEQTVLLAHYR